MPTSSPRQPMYVFVFAFSAELTSCSNTAWRDERPSEARHGIHFPSGPSWADETSDPEEECGVPPRQANRYFVRPRLNSASSRGSEVTIPTDRPARMRPQLLVQSQSQQKRLGSSERSGGARGIPVFRTSSKSLFLPTCSTSVHDVRNEPFPGAAGRASQNARMQYPSQQSIYAQCLRVSHGNQNSRLEQTVEYVTGPELRGSSVSIHFWEVRRVWDSRRYAPLVIHTDSCLILYTDISNFLLL